MRKTIILQYRINGDYNKTSYSIKKPKLNKYQKKNFGLQEVIFDYDELNENLVQSEIKRGKTFFSSVDGMLFGAINCLNKLGVFSYKQI